MLKPLTVWITTTWKILKEMGISDHPYLSPKTCLRVKKQQSEADMEQWNGSNLGKEYVKAVYCHPAYLIYIRFIIIYIFIYMQSIFNLYAEYIKQNARLDEAQAKIKIARRNINNLRYADDTTLNSRQ